MNRNTFTTLVLLVMVATCTWAQEVSIVPYVTVSGFAEDWVDPDVAVWSITISQVGKDLMDIKATNDQEFERVVSLAEGLGVPAEHIVVGRISVSRRYKKDKHGSSTGKFSHFALSRLVKVEQHDMAQFDSFLDKLLLSSELNVRLDYKATTADLVRSELRLKAVQAARDKAVAMAEVLQAEVGVPLIISEYPIITDYKQIDRLSMQSGVAIRATPERIHLKQKIFVRFELKSPVQTIVGP